MLKVKKQIINEKIIDEQIRVNHIENILKEYGIISETIQESLNNKLNKLFPNANKSLVYICNNKKYKLFFYKVKSDNSKNIVEIWKSDWFLIL